MLIFEKYISKTQLEARLFRVLCLLCGCVYASQYISFHLIRFIEYTAQQFFVQYSERFVFKLEMLYKFYIIIADVIFVRAPLLLLMVIFFYLILYSGIYISFLLLLCASALCAAFACSIDITNFIYLYVHFLFCGAQGDAFSIAVREICLQRNCVRFELPNGMSQQPESNQQQSIPTIFVPLFRQPKQNVVE